MSTQTAPAPSAPVAANLVAVPLSRLIRVELRKLTDTRAGRWLLIAIGIITLAVVTLYLFFAPSSQLTYQGFVGVTATPQGFLLPVLGILAVTSEWSQRTGLVTFTLEPSRGRVVIAKLIAVVILASAAVALLLAVAALGNVLGAALQGGDGSWTFGLPGVRDTGLLQLTGIIQGVAFGMILLNSAAAIVVSYVLPLAFSIVFNVVAALAEMAPWIDLGTAQTPLFDHTMQGNDWWKLLATTVWWVLLPLAAGVVRVLRSDLK